jgi:hypothetical protein
MQLGLEVRQILGSSTRHGHNGHCQRCYYVLKKEKAERKLLWLINRASAGSIRWCCRPAAPRQFIFVAIICSRRDPQNDCTSTRYWVPVCKYGRPTVLSVRYLVPLPVPIGSVRRSPVSFGTKRAPSMLHYWTTRLTPLSPKPFMLCSLVGSWKLEFLQHHRQNKNLLESLGVY